jgi:hypothetical protein
MNIKFDFWWLAVLGFLGFLFYNARLIKKERDVYLTEGLEYRLGLFYLWLPNWWTQRQPTLLNEYSTEKIEFFRSDTHYDWFCQFHLTSIRPSASLQLIADELLQSLQIALDPEISFQQPSFEFTKPLECLRMEGTGTRDDEDRIYLDLCLLRMENEQALIGLSLSSILNGCVEGPYFEEALKRIRKKT